MAALHKTLFVVAVSAAIISVVLSIFAAGMFFQAELSHSGCHHLQ
jgi:hypothetical protein